MQSSADPTDGTIPVESDGNVLRLRIKDLGEVVVLSLTPAGRIERGIYGIANMLIFHKLSDLDNVGDAGSAMRSLANSLLANAETRIVYRQESDQLGPTATALGLTGTEQKLLPALGVGQGLWKIKSRSFVTQHQLHPAELELFRTDARYLGEAHRLRNRVDTSE
jgi:hypothetical protein